MLHHIEPKYSLNYCTYMIWFEFELKTLKKINRKGNRNSRKKEKANSTQTNPLSLARAASVPDRRASPVGANPSALTPSLSLCPAVPTYQPSLTSRPRSPRRGRAHVRAFSSHVLSLVPLLSPALLAHLPSLICALN
jgi:hypothetical protein